MFYAKAINVQAIRGYNLQPLSFQRSATNPERPEGGMRQSIQQREHLLSNLGDCALFVVLLCGRNTSESIRVRPSLMRRF